MVVLSFWLTEETRVLVYIGSRSVPTNVIKVAITSVVVRSKEERMDSVKTYFVQKGHYF